MLTSWRAPSLMLLCVAGLYVFVRPRWIEAFGAGAYVAVAVGAGAVVGIAVAWWHARRRRYACPACARRFELSTARHLVSQNWFGRVRCRCPSCGRDGWCEPGDDDAAP